MDKLACVCVRLCEFHDSKSICIDLIVNNELINERETIAVSGDRKLLSAVRKRMQSYNKSLYRVSDYRAIHTKFESCDTIILYIHIQTPAENSNIPHAIHAKPKIETRMKSIYLYIYASTGIRLFAVRSTGVHYS